MKRYLIISLLVLAGLLWIQSVRLRNIESDRDRLRANQTSLMDSVRYYRTENGKNAASVQRLELSAAEIRAERDDVAAECRNLHIKIRRLESFSTAQTQTIVDLKTRLCDTVVLHDRDSIIVRDTLRLFRWRDSWVTVEGLIEGDSVGCRIESIDTLHQVVHRIPRRFLFIRWGTKAIRQEIVSSNPHTRIVYTEYIELKKRK